MRTCCGLGNGTHIFLQFEGVTCCSGCNSICCQYCTFELKEQDTNVRVHQKYCSKCFLEKKVILSSSINDHVPIDKMIKKLHKVSIEVQRDENIDVVLALYDHCITNNDVIFDESILTSCKMPFKTGKYLEQEFVLYNFIFREGGKNNKKSQFTYR